jgi:hypothetical protein
MSLSGRKQAIAFGIESEWGTESESFLTVGMLQGEPAVNSDNQLVNIFAGGRINSRAVLLGPRITGGRFDFFVQDGNFITASIGSWDTTSPVTNASNYMHYGTSEDSTSTETTPVEYESEPYTMKFGIQGESKNLTIIGCKTNSLTLNLTLNEPLRASVEFYGKKITTDTDVQEITEIGYGPYMYHNAGTLTLNSENLADVQSLSVSVANSLKREHGATPASDAREIVALHQGSREITGNITLNYDDDTEFDLFQAGTEFDVGCLLDNGETSTTADYRGISITLKDVKLSSLGDRTYPIDGTSIRETFNFTARKIECTHYDATNSDAWS